ncbi:hypothetical protein EMCRGX_G002244 [Ephydatia muelleri]
MDKVLHGLSFVTSYIDDALIHSSSMELHQSHLCLVLNRLVKAGLTLRDSKCKIRLDKVQYLGHIFSKHGMAPDTDKIAVVQNWPTPTDVTEKGFTLQTDASAVGIGAGLEQEGHVIAYASRSLTPPERQYSVMERECLAVAFAVKHFRRYLLGRPFSLHTDHQPLHWLSAQKMEGRILEEQQRDAVLQQVIQHLTLGNSTSNLNWKQFPLKQLLKQLHLVDSVLCHRFVPGIISLSEVISVDAITASPVHQRVLSKKLEDPDLIVVESIITAWLLSVSAPHAASWLLVTPPSLDLNFEPMNCNSPSNGG